MNSVHLKSFPKGRFLFLAHSAFENNTELCIVLCFVVSEVRKFFI
jgi:hypothetical protein